MTCGEAAYPVYDMHCHLGFSSNVLQAAQEISQAGSGAFATCVEPNEYLRAKEKLASWPCVRVGVGVHPWWVAQGRVTQAQVASACAAVAHERFVGEVGLDFSARYHDSEQAQRDAFERIMQSCAQAGQRVVSLHAVHSADAVLDILEETGAVHTCTCIFHWYSDTPEALQRAIKLGCLFSLGRASLNTRRGREYVRQIPAQRLLVETDLPEQGQPYEVELAQRELRGVVAQMEELKGCALREQIGATSRRVLGLD